MQYLVIEVHGKTPTSQGEARMFNSIEEVIKYLTGINKDKRLRVDQTDLDPVRLSTLLAERLSTAVVSIEFEEERKWIVSAF